jgi:multicomponent Na+:H+ antiporter subunit F
MNTVYYVATIALFVTFGAGIVRILRGPTHSDRMLAAQLFGTSGVAVLLLLSYVMDEPALIDVGLVFALLAAMAVVAFVQRSGHPQQPDSARLPGGRAPNEGGDDA